jgi:septal ring factor EnvC (AmiA/AmiB activator)
VFGSRRFWAPAFWSGLLAFLSLLSVICVQVAQYDALAVRLIEMQGRISETERQRGAAVDETRELRKMIESMGQRNTTAANHAAAEPTTPGPPGIPCGNFPLIPEDSHDAGTNRRIR